MKHPPLGLGELLHRGGDRGGVFDELKTGVVLAEPVDQRYRLAVAVVVGASSEDEWCAAAASSPLSTSSMLSSRYCATSPTVGERPVFVVSFSWARWTFSASS